MKFVPSALLFDLDGVLVDSVDAWLAALNAAMKISGYELITKKEFINKCWGFDLNSTVSKIGLDKKIVAICNKSYEDHIDKVKLMPEVKETLEELINFKKAVITNTPRDRTIQVMDKLNLRNYFSTIVTSDDVKSAKPSPEIIFKACKNLKVKTNEVVAIGDTLSDVKAGKAAGCKVIGLNIQADYKIEKISDLVNILKQLELD
jgi:HAD superfamily hydrolase (TIGR01509 family)